jgi:aspartate 1-decarboxylase
MLKSKIHRATVTEANLEYEGSITIDAALMKAAELIAGEKVLVADLTNGERLETYVIAAKAGSGIICMNGATAHKIKVGDLVIIMAFGFMDVKEISTFTAKKVRVNKENKVIA